MTRPWTRADTSLALLAALAVGLPSFILRSHALYSLDSAILAVGVRRYDFASYSPHPPFYPLTIAAAKLLAMWMGPSDALTALAIASVTVMGGATYVVGRTLGGRAVGLWACAALALSPLVLANGAVPLSYSSEGGASAAVAALALKARAARRRGWTWALAAAASVAVGLRPSSVLWAGPLLLWVARRDLVALGQTLWAGAAATLAWFLPMLAAGGGWRWFRFGSTFQSRNYILQDPAWEGGWDAVRNDLAWMAYHVRFELAAALAIATLGFIAAFAPGRLLAGGHRWFLTAWLAPTTLFYIFVYMGWPIFPSGYLMALAPGVAVAGALLLHRALALVRDPAVDRPARLLGTLTVAALAALPLAWPLHWDDALRQRDAVEAWDASWAGLDDVLPANDTALLASYAGPWALVHHPDHLLWASSLAVDEAGTVRWQVTRFDEGRPDKPYFVDMADGPIDAPHPVPTWVKRIAIVEGHPMDGSRPLVDAPTTGTTLPGGRVVRVVDASGVGTIEEILAGYGEPPPPLPWLIWPPS